MDGLRIEPLGPETWDAYAALIERHNGIFGGCWCTWFHDLRGDKRLRAQAGEDNRAFKERLVREGEAHAAVVFDGDRAVAWCQYGKPEDLPNIHHRKEYEATSARQPDYRLTCIFVDRDYRRKGVAEFALRGALDLIARAGGGVPDRGTGAVGSAGARRGLALSTPGYFSSQVTCTSILTLWVPGSIGTCLAAAASILGAAG